MNQVLVRQLASSFKRWGREATERVRDATRKYGVIFSVFKSASERVG